MVICCINSSSTAVAVALWGIFDADAFDDENVGTISWRCISASTAAWAYKQVKVDSATALPEQNDWKRHKVSRQMTVVSVMVKSSHGSE